MKLRSGIEPRFEIAEKLYPEILNQILQYTTLREQEDDEDNTAYRALANKLHTLTGKDLSSYNLWEYWEEEGAEVLAFRIALPDPPKTDDISEDEVLEIFRRIGHFEASSKDWDERTFAEKFSLYLDGYYHKLLKLNFVGYDYQKLFGPQKGKEKKQFWWTDEEKTALLWEASH